jgi:hypothetical protein
MKLTLNELSYGNPTTQDKEALDSKCSVDELFSELKDLPFPENDSESTVQELDEITSLISDISTDENSKYLNRYKFYDRNLFQAITNSFQTDDIDVDELCEKVKKDIHNLIIRLKYKYNRPRPSQLASYYKVKLFPYSTKTSNNPSYPSASIVYAKVILTIIGDVVPDFNERATNMIKDIEYSRQYLGLNFQSDIDFSIRIAEEILKLPEFTKKYKI